MSQVPDQLGIRRARIDWRIGELERRTASEYVRTVASELERLRVGSYDLKQAAILEDEKAWVKLATDNNHHVGTTRMHESDKLGVVDSNCQVHGIQNLYIGSSFVFPSSGSAYPTLTTLALCIRVADRVKNLLGLPSLWNFRPKELFQKQGLAEKLGETQRWKVLRRTRLV